MKYILALLLFASALNASASEKEILYTATGGLNEALRFASVPTDEIEKYKRSIRGDLASKEIVYLAEQIIEARSERSREKIESLLHAESLQLLKKTPDEVHVHDIPNQIASGDFLYQEVDPTFFTTVLETQASESADFFEFTETKPNKKIIFYHYNKNKGMMIGSTLFIVDGIEGAKIQLASRKLKPNQSE